MQGIFTELKSGTMYRSLKGNGSLSREKTLQKNTQVEWVCGTLGYLIYEDALGKQYYVDRAGLLDTRPDPDYTV